jgi:hypothetical protein
LMPAAAALAVLLAITGVALRLRKTVEPTSQIAMSRPDALPPANSAPATNPAAPPEGAPPTAVASPPPARTDQFSARLSAPATSRSDTAGVPIARSESGASRELGAQSPPRVVEGAHPATRGLELSRVGAASGGLAGKSAAAPVKQPQPPAPQTSAGMARGAMRAGSGGGVGSGSAGGVGPGTANSADETATVMEAAPLVNTAEPTKVVPEKKAESDLAKTDSQVSVEAETAPQPNARKTRSSATTATAGAAGLAAPSAPAQSAKAMNLAASKATEAAALARMQEAQISSNLMNLQIHTPDPKILWMIAGAGAIEKSEDGGATWKTKDLDTLALILAGAAPSVKICWLVGANATILRTTNGEHWKTIKPPAETDFVRVDATDALTSTVTALDGRKFSTGDGGKSWNNVK